MKKLLFTFFLFCVATFTFSQSLTLSNGQGPLPNNSNVSVVGGVDPLECYVTVNNITGSNKTVECKKALIQNVTGSMNYFCWGLCYPPNTYVGISPVVIPANQSNNTNFSGHYDCQGNTGTCIVRYIFWVEGNPLDSVCFNVSYTGCTVGINEIEQQPGLSEAYPNPARDYVSLRYSVKSDNNAFIDLVSFQGALISRVPVSAAQGATSLSVSGLSKGIYFLMLSDNGIIVSRKKLMVE